MRYIKETDSRQEADDESHHPDAESTARERRKVKGFQSMEGCRLMQDKR